MDKSSVDPIILKQQLIHVKSELDKYKKQLQIYRDASPFVELECLKQDVKELNEQNLILNDQIASLEEQLGVYKKRIVVNRIKNQIYSSHFKQINEDLKSLEEKHSQLQEKYKQLIKNKNSYQIIKVENPNLQNKESTTTHLENSLQRDQNLYFKNDKSTKLTSIEDAFRQLLIKNILNWLDVIIQDKTQLEYSSVRNQLISILEEKMLKVEKEIDDLEEHT